jgi:hypothetical protein
MSSLSYSVVSIDFSHTRFSLSSFILSLLMACEDLFTRPRKFRGTATFSLIFPRLGREVPEIPRVALVADLDAAHQPCLVTHGTVETMYSLFHLLRLVSRFGLVWRDFFCPFFFFSKSK